MDTLKEILFKKHYIREIITLFFIVLSLVFLSIYTSFALFEKTVEKVGVASIAASSVNFYIATVDSATNATTKSISVPANSYKFFDVRITNSTSIDAKYKLYTTSTSSSITVGISNKSDGLEEDIIYASAGETTKVVRVGIKNTSSSSISVTIGIQGGYANNELTLNSGRYELGSISEVPTYTDTSGANEPNLVTGLIPVVYDEDLESWVKADTDIGWYNYDAQIWANAVTVTSTNRSTYQNADPGTVISMDDINSMWVWIPRYKYLIASNTASSSTVAEPPEIDVVFESGTTTSGVTLSTSGVATTSYYTHPAFRKGSSVYKSTAYDQGGWTHELTGFWASKFELSGTYSSGYRNIETVTIKPDGRALARTDSEVGYNVEELYSASLRFTQSGNSFGLPTTVSSTTDASGTHMIKNTEWGAIAYLSQSQYGKMGNGAYSGTNKEIYYNNSSAWYSGRSSGSPTGTPTTEGTYKYNQISTTTTSTTLGNKVTPTITNDSTYPWVINNGAYKSQTQGIHSTTTNLTYSFILEKNGTLSFDWSVSSESASYDYIYYTITKDGTTMSNTGTTTKIGGTSYGTADASMTYTTVTKNLEPGVYKLTFTYRKDSSANNGTDAGYVKNLSIIQDKGISSSLTNDSTYPWVINNGAYKSQTQGINSSTTNLSYSFTLENSGTLSFDWSVSSESASYDYIYYTITKDGTTMSDTGTTTKIGGTSYGTADASMTYTTVTKNLEPGVYKLTFTYRKDGSVNNGTDAGYVKNVVVKEYVQNETLIASGGGPGASTTGTIYGLYDMNGGGNEYVMSYSNSVSSEAGFGSTASDGVSHASWSDVPSYHTEKYTSTSNTNGYFILGDATYETSNWYDDYPQIFHINSTSWYRRGGSSSDTSAADSGIYNYGRYSGSGLVPNTENGGATTTRVILVP